MTIKIDTSTIGTIRYGLTIRLLSVDDVAVAAVEKGVDAMAFSTQQRPAIDSQTRSMDTIHSLLHNEIV